MMSIPASERVVAFILVLLAAPLVAEAQPGAKVSRVGVLSVAPLSSLMFPREFPEALRDLGYVDKQNIIVEWRSADGSSDRLAGLAAELVRLEVDVIVAVTNPEILAAKQATTTIPIVMVAANDPVAIGLVATLARPGGNITGRMWIAPETSGKVLEVLKEAVPTIRRVVHLGSAGVPGLATIVQGTQAAAQALGLTLRVVQLRQTDDVARVLHEVRRWQPDALYVSPVGISDRHRDAILKFAVQRRLPAVSGIQGFVHGGGLMAYSPSTIEAARRTASYVERILKGARPADLPVEQPQTFDLAINLRTAKQIGLTIPQSILLRADTLIE
jgi:putative ABC transport system substrate-binding protein